MNKESFSTLYSHKEPFYMLTLLKGHIFCVKHAVKLLVPSSRNESPAHFVDSSFRDDSRGREAVSRHVSLRTSRNAQAILISYILTDGSAQAVSDVVEAISVFLRRLR